MVVSCVSMAGSLRRGSVKTGVRQAGSGSEASLHSRREAVAVASSLFLTAVLPF